MKCYVCEDRLASDSSGGECRRCSIALKQGQTDGAEVGKEGRVQMLPAKLTLWERTLGYGLIKCSLCRVRPNFGATAIFRRESWSTISRYPRVCESCQHAYRKGFAFGSRTFGD